MSKVQYDVHVYDRSRNYWVFLGSFSALLNLHYNHSFREGNYCRKTKSQYICFLLMLKTESFLSSQAIKRPLVNKYDTKKIFSVVSGKANWHSSKVFLLNQLGSFFLAEINQGKR